MAKRKGKHCTICLHKARPQIEVGLVNKISMNVLARRFAVSPDALYRHIHKHLSPAAKAAILIAMRPSRHRLRTITAQ